MEDLSTTEDEKTDSDNSVAPIPDLHPANAVAGANQDQCRHDQQTGNQDPGRGRLSYFRERPFRNRHPHQGIQIVDQASEGRGRAGRELARLSRSNRSKINTMMTMILISMIIERTFVVAGQVQTCPRQLSMAFSDVMRDATIELRGW